MSNSVDIIVFGYTKLGRDICINLREKGLKFLLFDNTLTKVGEAMKDGFTLKYFELMSDDELRSIGIGSSVKTLFCVEDDSHVNAFVTFSARRLDENLNIITIALDNNEKRRLKAAGANRVITPNRIGAIRAKNLLLRPNSTKLMDEIYKTNQLLVSDIEISSKSQFSGKSVKSLNIKKGYGVIILGVSSSELTRDFIFLNEHSNYNIKSGDMLVVLGKKEVMDKFIKASKIEG